MSDRYAEYLRALHHVYTFEPELTPNQLREAVRSFTDACLDSRIIRAFIAKVRLK